MAVAEKNRSERAEITELEAIFKMLEPCETRKERSYTTLCYFTLSPRVLFTNHPPIAQLLKNEIFKLRANADKDEEWLTAETERIFNQLFPNESFPTRLQETRL